MPLGSACLLLAALASCEKSEPGPVAYTGPTLSYADYGGQEVETSRTGYEIVEQEPSVGRFPGALAVARLEPPGIFRVTDDPDRPCWRIGTMPEQEATYWNALFNTVPYVQEVLVLDELVVTWPDADQIAINQAARRLNSDLCLIYGPSPAPPEHAALAGVILDAHRGHTVAYVSAQAGPEDNEPPPDDTYENDLRHRDPNYLVARKFEWQVRRCVAELKDRDQPLPTTLPSDWRQDALERNERSIYIVPNRDVRW